MDTVYGWLDDYLTAKKHCEKDFKPEWEWHRYMINGKMFAAICESDDVPLLTVKLEPLYGEFLRENHDDIIPGYYMNKTHWNSVRLTGSVPDELIKDMIDKSYQLIYDALPKKVRAAFEAENRA